VALPEFRGALGVAELDLGQEFEQELDLKVGRVGPQLAGAAGPLE
jgi:hypothetical protein